jgi:hypothetical protein
MTWFEQEVVGMEPSVLIGIVYGLERYLMCELRWWLD